MKSPCLSLDGSELELIVMGGVNFLRAPIKPHVLTGYSFDEFTSELECSTIVRAFLLVDKALELKFIGHEPSPIRNKLNSAALQPLEDVLEQLIGHAYLSENKVHWVFMMFLTFVRNFKGWFNSTLFFSNEFFEEFDASLVAENRPG